MTFFQYLCYFFGLINWICLKHKTIPVLPITNAIQESVFDQEILDDSGKEQEVTVSPIKSLFFIYIAIRLGLTSPETLMQAIFG